jgi:hypothetical protein
MLYGFLGLAGLEQTSVTGTETRVKTKPPFRPR